MADYNININAKDNASGSIGKISGGLGGLTGSANKFKVAMGATWLKQQGQPVQQ